MRHRNRGRKLNRNESHRRSLMRNMARALILSPNGRIITTTAKAKEARPFVERLVTLARHGDEASRRRAASILGEHAPSHRRAAGADKKGAGKWSSIPPKPRNAVDRKRWRRMGLPVVPEGPIPVALDRLFAEIGPKFKERPGGYTRILRLGKRRLGDNAEQVLLEFVVSVAAPVAPGAEEAGAAKSKGKAKKGKKAEAKTESAQPPAQA